jgi:hypothetical protein
VLACTQEDSRSNDRHHIAQLTSMIPQSMSARHRLTSIMMPQPACKHHAHTHQPMMLCTGRQAGRQGDRGQTRCFLGV